MTAMQIMERCRTAEADRRAIKNRAARYRESATRITSVLGGVGSRSTSEPDKLAALMSELDELDRALNEREREYAAELSAATRLLDMLPEIESQVLDAFYLKAQALTAIARSMSYSYGYIRTVKATACAHLEVLPEALVSSLLPAWYLERSPGR